jgi:predicted PurR-regulated permease PerM
VATDGKEAQVPAAHLALARTALLLGVACVVVSADFLGTVVFASWLVTTFYPLFARLAPKLGSALASLAMTVVILLSIVAPLVVTGIILTSRLVDLVGQVVALWQSGNLRSAGGALIEQQGGKVGLGDLYREAARAVPTLLVGVGKIFSILSDAGIKSFLFVLLVYGLFGRGRTVQAWISRASPLGEKATRELMSTYAETGRGILVGVFAVVIVHGIVASTGYAIIGIARAVELGALTAVAGMVPAIGTALVWVPLTVVLAVSGHVKQAVFVLIVGLIVGSVDNLLRPVLSRLGRVPLTTLPMFVAFFAGVATFGASGVLLGPLLFALARKAIELWADQKAAAQP